MKHDPIDKRLDNPLSIQISGGQLGRSHPSDNWKCCPKMQIQGNVTQKSGLTVKDNKIRQNKKRTKKCEQENVITLAEGDLNIHVKNLPDNQILKLKLSDVNKKARDAACVCVPHSYVEQLKNEISANKSNVPRLPPEESKNYVSLLKEEIILTKLKGVQENMKKIEKIKEEIAHYRSHGMDEAVFDLDDSVVDAPKSYHQPHPKQDLNINVGPSRFDCYISSSKTRKTKKKKQTHLLMKKIISRSRHKGHVRFKRKKKRRNVSKKFKSNLLESKLTEANKLIKEVRHNIKLLNIDTDRRSTSERDSDVCKSQTSKIKELQAIGDLIPELTNIVEQSRINLEQIKAENAEQYTTQERCCSPIRELVSQESRKTRKKKKVRALNQTKLPIQAIKINEGNEAFCLDAIRETEKSSIGEYSLPELTENIKENKNFFAILQSELKKMKTEIEKCEICKQKMKDMEQVDMYKNQLKNIFELNQCTNKECEEFLFLQQKIAKIEKVSCPVHELYIILLKLIESSPNEQDCLINTLEMELVLQKELDSQSERLEQLKKLLKDAESNGQNSTALKEALEIAKDHYNKLLLRQESQLCEDGKKSKDTIRVGKYIQNLLRKIHDRKTKEAGNERKLEVQKMPPISIPTGLKVQETLKMNIYPCTPPNVTENVGYVEIHKADVDTGNMKSESEFIPPKVSSVPTTPKEDASAMTQNFRDIYARIGNWSGVGAEKDLRMEVLKSYQIVDSANRILIPADTITLTPVAASLLDDAERAESRQSTQRKFQYEPDTSQHLQQDPIDFGFMKSIEIQCSGCTMQDRTYKGKRYVTVSCKYCKTTDDNQGRDATVSCKNRKPIVDSQERNSIESCKNGKPTYVSQERYATVSCESGKPTDVSQSDYTYLNGFEEYLTNQLTKQNDKILVDASLQASFESVSSDQTTNPIPAVEEVIHVKELDEEIVTQNGESDKEANNKSLQTEEINPKSDIDDEPKHESSSLTQTTPMIKTTYSSEILKEKKEADANLARKQRTQKSASFLLDVERESTLFPHGIHQKERRKSTLKTEPVVEETRKSTREDRSSVETGRRIIGTTTDLTPININLGSVDFDNKKTVPDIKERQKIAAEISLTPEDVSRSSGKVRDPIEKMDRDLGPLRSQTNQKTQMKDESVDAIQTLDNKPIQNKTNSQPQDDTNEQLEKEFSDISLDETTEESEYKTTDYTVMIVNTTSYGSKKNSSSEKVKRIRTECAVAEKPSVEETNKEGANDNKLESVLKASEIDKFRVPTPMIEKLFRKGYHDIDKYEKPDCCHDRHVLMDCLRKRVSSPYRERQPGIVLNEPSTACTNIPVRNPGGLFGTTFGEILKDNSPSSHLKKPEKLLTKSDLRKIRFDKMTCPFAETCSPDLSSEGELKCRCDVSEGEYHKCPYAKHLVKYYNGTPAQGLKANDLPFSKHAEQREHYKNWVTYYVNKDAYKNDSSTTFDSESSK